MKQFNGYQGVFVHVNNCLYVSNYHELSRLAFIIINPTSPHQLEFYEKTSTGTSHFCYGLFRMGALISLTSLTQLTQMSEMMKRRLEMMRLKFLRMRVINQRKKSRKVITMERKAMRR